MDSASARETLLGFSPPPTGTAAADNRLLEPECDLQIVIPAYNVEAYLAQQRFPCAGRIHGGSPAENRRGCVQDAFQGAFDRTFQRRCCHSITSKNSILFPGWKVNIPASG